MDRWQVASKDMNESCSDHNFITYNISPKSIIYLYFLYLRRDICLKPLYLFHFREAKYSKTWQTFHFIMHLTYCRHCLLNINFKLISGARFALFLCFSFHFVFSWNLKLNGTVNFNKIPGLFLSMVLWVRTEK